MASMAEAGGFLVYGVKEDKGRHTFTPDEMDLPAGLHETVDAIARNRITPALNGIPTIVPNPVTRTMGFLVVEIPESPDSPHMADFTYWAGRKPAGSGCRMSGWSGLCSHAVGWTTSLPARWARRARPRCSAGSWLIRTSGGRPCLRPSRSAPEFRDEAVKMVIETSRPIARVANDMVRDNDRGTVVT
jgi:hypothetical protein